jgi:hypothetical protein
MAGTWFRTGCSNDTSRKLISQNYPDPLATGRRMPFREGEKKKKAVSS